MPSAPRSVRHTSRLWLFATALALIAQTMLALAPLADARGVGAPAHIESAGDHHHYTHNEATCAACTLAALHVVAPPVAVWHNAPANTEFRLTTAVPRPITHGRPHINFSRAPPPRL